MVAFRSSASLALLAAALCACDASAPQTPAGAGATVGTWRPGAKMHEARSQHSMTVLGSGEVLVAGGWERWNDDYTLNCTTTAEIYDPATDQWRYTAPMGTPRCLHGAVLLDDGTVLVAGGHSIYVVGPHFRDPEAHPWPVSHASAEIFDPASETWSPAASMTNPRIMNGNLNPAQKLPDGTVLVAGVWQDTLGDRFGPESEIYDPTGAGTWRAAGRLPSAQYGPTVRLESGLVLAAGGISFPSFATTTAVALFEPSDAGSWRPLPSLPAARAYPSLVLLGTGEALLAGGCSSQAAWPCPRSGASAQGIIFDAATLQTRATSSMHHGHYWGAAVTLQSGRALLVPGNAVADQSSVLLTTIAAQVYDPWLDAWLPTPVMPTNVNAAGAVALLPSGEVLYAGGTVWDGTSTFDGSWDDRNTFSLSAVQIFRE